MKTKNYKLIISLILIISFLISLYSIHLMSQKEDLIKLEESHMPDFHHQINIIKEVAETGKMPLVVKGLLEVEYVWHSPLYYYIAGLVYRLTNSIISLHILSAIIILITNILFLLFINDLNLKKITKIYSLAIFSFLPTHLHISMMITNDPLFYLTLMLTIYIFSKFIKTPDIKNTILLGLSLGLSLLTRVVALILFLAIPLFLLIKRIREKIFISLIIGIILGSYPIIRNYLLFGELYSIAQDMLLKKPYVIIRSFIAFWGGVWGGLRLMKPILIIIVIIISLLTIWYIIKYHNFKNHSLNLILAIAVINIILSLHWNCYFFIFIKTMKCMSIDATQSRYLLGIEPAIAIFSSITLTKLSKNNIIKIIAPFLIFLAVVLFSIDFIYAFI